MSECVLVAGIRNRTLVVTLSSLPSNGRNYIPFLWHDYSMDLNLNLALWLTGLKAPTN